ncbi:Cupin domain-containing protein [Lutibacter sp. Hel_I_33_5]|uniref:cupin domain-containing protein n=1 Tax=Lutibacter sp. Hel_I_33_5 TaxID=1566289 RepID=UPI0011AAD898|nr:cupin domain-containing protein [Lutibacter sp. Hel_I_33_5]TVZ54792.1 Cupin domain-containing protein [Lutibacter sp. Hel_I_33_5]
MDRKKFIQTTGIGLGFALIPGILQGKESKTKNSLSKNVQPKIIKDSEGDVLNVIGDIQTHKLIGSDTDNQLVEWVDNVEPGVGIPPHIHTKEDEIFRVIKGQIEIMVNGKTTVLHEGDVAFAPKNIPHSWKVVGTEKAKMITSAFPAGIEYMFKELSKLPAGPPNFKKVAEICAKHGISFV